MTGIAFVLHSSDNVATVLGGDVRPGETIILRGVATGSIIAAASIPDGHKIALQEMAIGGRVVKYGASIGRTTMAVRAGDHVHIHNMESMRGRGDLGRSAGSPVQPPK